MLRLLQGDVMQSLSILGVAALLVGCGGTSPAEPVDCTVRIEDRCWTHLGLDGRWVTALAATEWGLYAGTHDDGVFRLDPATGTWQSLGLDHAIVSSILFVSGSTERLLVGMIAYSDEQTEAAVFASTDSGRTWQPWDGGLAARRGNRGWAYSLGVDPGNPERLFMGYFDMIVRSEDGGRSWQFVNGEQSLIGGGVNRAIVVSPRRDGRVWVAGETSLFTGVVWRSTDWGDSWEFIDPMPLNEVGIWTLALDEGNSDRVIAGTVGGVLRSDDAGTSWHYVSFLRTPGAVLALAVMDGALYAVSDENARPEPGGGPGVISDLGLYRSYDGGKSWERLATPDGARGGRSLLVESQGQLLIGTRTLGSGGVWRLRL